MKHIIHTLVRLVLFASLSLLLQAQTVTNVVAEQVGKTIEISYTLDKTTDIIAEFSTDGKTYTKLNNATGAVGSNVSAGRNKIVWNPLLDYDKMVYDGLSFRITPTPTVRDSVTDCQGHTYPVVKIGNQYWMAENLQCTKYDTESERAGVELTTSVNSTLNPYYTDGRQFIDKYSDNLTPELRQRLGLLYNWAAAVGLASESEARTISYVRRQGICPNGWHIPSHAEWNTLKKYIEKTDGNGSGTAGTHLKSTSGWYNNGNGTDKYGFTLLPASGADGSNCYVGVGGYSYLWTASPTGALASFTRIVNYQYRKIFGDVYFMKEVALSVRCIKNQ